MSLQFILGPPGSGKTTHCLREMEAAIPGTAPLYYLVPEQFSLQSERLLLANRAATTRVQVLSFNRLAYRVFALLGGPPGQVADDLGKTMLLRKVLLEIADDLVFYARGADKHGFVDSLAATITELNHYCVSSEDLLLRSQQAGPAFGAKLKDLALIISRYRGAVKGRYLLADDMLDLLVHKLATEELEIPLLKGAQVWADGFTGFTPQERQVLLYLMKQGADIRITLTTRNMTAPDSLFATPQATEEKLAALAKDAHIPMEPTVYLKENYRHAPNSNLAFFTQNFSMRPRQKGGSHAGTAKSSHHTRAVQPGHHTGAAQPCTPHGIEILSAPDRYNAVYAAAHRILTWVNQGYRFKDIAIVCGDRGHYEKTLQAAFDRLGIPLFVDTEIDILSHPLTELIRSALSILAHNWKYEAVFRFIKTRLTGLDMDDADILENFAIAHGISGYKWRYPFSGPAEEGRQHLIAALEAFGTSQAKDTIRSFSSKVFQMLYDLKVPETLQQWFDAHMAAGDPATARIHKQIWPKICEVFDKLVEILGDEKVTLDNFSSVLDAGLSQVGLGRIPPTVDQVVLGDMGRSRYPQIKAMLVLGANDGVLPPIAPSPGLFTEDERRQLKNTAIELAPDNLTRINEQYYTLYCTLSQPSQNICFIYAEGDPRGKVLSPSHVLKRVQALFPSLETQKAPILREYEPVISASDDIYPPSDAASIDGIYPPSNALDEASSVFHSAKDIYGQTIITAASRLEAFARCPFAYFMNYLLQAKPRQRYQVLPTDLGTLYHEVLARFTNDIARGSVDVKALTRRDISSLVSKMVSETTPETTVFHASARNQHVLNKVEGICSASIWALCEQIKRGGFVPLGAELDFGQIFDSKNDGSPVEDGIHLSDGRRLLLSGRIDRVDMLKGPGGEQYVRIIDYKSGNARFNMAEVEQGLQLQLMLYMNAIVKNPNTSGNLITHPAGVFYFPIDDPVIDVDTDIGEAATDAALLKHFRLSGVALEGNTILEGMDNALAPGIDSSVIPVRLNKDGRVAKPRGGPVVLLAEDFEKLSQVAEDKVKELGARMVGGDIEAKPCSLGQKSPCRYCRYDAVCNTVN